MPPCSAPYLLGYLFEVGPAMHTGMGDAPLSHSEIAAWQANTGIRLTAWEARTLRRLSVDYVNETARATLASAKAPWVDEDMNVERVVASGNTKDAIRNLLKL